MLLIKKMSTVLYLTQPRHLIGLIIVNCSTILLTENCHLALLDCWLSCTLITILVIWNGVQSRWFGMMIGVKQGGVLSPTLLCVY